MERIQLLIVRIAFTLKNRFTLSNILPVEDCPEKYVSFSIPKERDAKLLSKVVSPNSKERIVSILLANFEDKYTTPFLLYSLGYKYEEIAYLLFLPSDIVRSRVFYLQKKMQTLLIDIAKESLD